jgi:hypothetical protein
MAGPPLTLDHVAIGCATLEQGAAYVRDRLGVDVPSGGRHELMGTHNLLMRLGGETYLELIAIDPAGTKPPYPRWFALDDPAQQARLRERPRPVAWIARATDVAATLAACPSDLGRPVEMTRGDLRWRTSLRGDGMLPEGGALPVLIAWPQGPHPSVRMRDLGVRLTKLTVTHPEPARIATALAALGAQQLVMLESRAAAASIALELRSPGGAIVTLA